MIELEARPFLELVHEGQPQPWQRAGRGKRNQSFTPEPYRSFKEALGWSMRRVMRRAAPTAEPVALSATFHRQGHGVCDMDNLLKAVMDAGNAIVWRDDRLIRWVRDLQLWTGVTERPRLELTVWQIVAAPPEIMGLLRGAAR